VGIWHFASDRRLSSHRTALDTENKMLRVNERNDQDVVMCCGRRQKADGESVAAERLAAGKTREARQ